jgi:Family of unknown function (DUF6152)
MRTLRTLALGVIGVLVTPSPLLAHHDWPVDRTTLITVTGTVTAFAWSDPHVTIALDVQANGTIEKWKVGGSNKKNSAANGWDKNTLKPGDVITGIGFRFKDGSNAAQLQKIVLASGKEMDLYGRLAVLPAADPTSTGRERRP